MTDPSPQEPRFLADDMVGKLARWLRILGLDVAPAGRVDDNSLMRRALDESRVLLTRHGRLLGQISAKDLKPRRSELRWIVLESPHLLPQIAQVLQVTDIRIDTERLFTRCLICNSPLEPASKADVAGEVPEFTYSIQDQYSRCRNCNKVYWKGTHTDRILKKLEPLRR
ncbi:MAG: Mut7-C RNAse domain-containing protein [Verrucomicrobia bacterium]|nr:Mut7-C RNAse domain-containing protein [Verrucomicrobiota bacterium]